MKYKVMGDETQKSAIGLAYCPSHSMTIEAETPFEARDIFLSKMTIRNIKIAKKTILIIETK